MMIVIRTFQVLLTFALAVESCTGSLPDPYTVEDIINSRCGPAEACYPTSARIEQLDREMAGYITRQTDVKYTTENLMYNKEEQRTTHMIAMVKTKEDVQKAVLFAREFNLHVTIKSTGHDYAGRSTWADSFVIHLGLMKKIEVNPSATDRSTHGELKTETGTNWATIYKLLDEYDRVIVGGSAHTVGPGGYTLGGGHSPISRSLGYAVDNVLEMQVVLADGSIATCTETQAVIEHVDGTMETHADGDLFWALRGGGGGTFGVTVYIVFKLHQAPSQMVLFSGTFPFIYESPPEIAKDIMGDIMSALANFIPKSSSDWGGYWIIGNAPFSFYHIQMRGSLFLFLNKFGPYDSNTEKDLAEFLALKEKHGLLDVTISNKTSFWDYEQNAQDQASADTYLATSLFDDEHVERNLSSFFREELFTNWRDFTKFGCTGALVGGKTKLPSVTSTPLSPGYRSAVSSVSCGVGLTGIVGSERERLITRAKSFAYRIREMGQGMYFNEPSIDLSYWREDCWGKTNYERLVQIKERYDPDNFFTCYHCVNSDTTSYPWSRDGDDTSGSIQVRAEILTALFSVVLIAFIYYF